MSFKDLHPATASARWPCQTSHLPLTLAEHEVLSSVLEK